MPDLKLRGATFPLPGIMPEILREDGKATKSGEKGHIVIDRP